MKLNKEAVTNAIFELSKTTTNKFWGVLAIISSIDRPIKPNKTYKLSSSQVMGFLDSLFNLNNETEHDYQDSTIYVKFSTDWKEKLEALTLKNKPSLKNAAIFFCKNKEYNNSQNTRLIKDTFVNDCKIVVNNLDDLFEDVSDDTINVSSYGLPDLVVELESKFSATRKEDSHLSLESPYFIRSRPSELKRAPFIQTLYSGDRIKELLLLSDSNLEELYPVLEDEIPTITSGTTIQDFIESLSKVNLQFSDLLVTRFYASLLTKPFIILTGLSGSGKTKLAQAFVQWICNEKAINYKRFKDGEELISHRVTYKVIQADLNSVTLSQIDSNTKVTLPYELIYEWIDVIRKNDFTISTPTREIRDLVGQFTNYSTQLNSFESHLRVAAFALIAKENENSESKSQYLIIPVGADWTNREPLLGYPNALKPEEYVKPDSGVLDLIIQANQHPDLPHFLILDEMNLSHVERYFADFLSVMESREPIPLYAEGTVNNGVPAKLNIPPNLFIIGTVNIDETTNMFSPKVLDRANTIEFRVTKEEMERFLGNIKDINMDALSGKGAGMAKSFLDMVANKSFATEDIDDIKAALVKFFGELAKTGAEFGYRSATEILRLIHQLSMLDNSLTTNQKVDIAIMQKLLPKLHGSRRKLSPVLETLGSFCIADDIKIINEVFQKGDFDFNGTNVLYPLSLEKIARMYRGAADNGFASFAEA